MRAIGANPAAVLKLLDDRENLSKQMAGEILNTDRRALAIAREALIAIAAHADAKGTDHVACAYEALKRIDAILNGEQK